MVHSKRDLIGYGSQPPHPQWPNGARLALSFVLNYEEGGERSPLNGDDYSETYGGEFPLVAKPAGVRGLSMESLFDYGGRAGVWRILRLFERHEMPLTVFAVGQALEQNPEVARAFAAQHHEVAGHGWRWVDYAEVPLDEERLHIERTVQLIEHLCGARPVGWYTGRRSAHTRDLVIEYGGFLYDSDNYSDDLPFYDCKSIPHLVLPYNLDCNDFRFGTSPGFSSPEDFYQHLKHTFDGLYEEGRIHPKMMTVGLHARISGRPGRARALKRFLDYVAGFDAVWVCRRADIARHWWSTHPPQKK